VFCIDPDGDVRSLPTPFGRPQGLVFSPDGALHVVDALAGASALYRFADVDRPPELVVAAPSLIGVAFGPSGQLAVCSGDTVYRFESS
jgi:sugar lactone lactonase YvrE